MLVVGHVEALNDNDAYEMVNVPTLEAAEHALSTRHFDGVLCHAPAKCYDSMRLPSMLLDLKDRGRLSELPVVFWHGCSECKLLECHALVAKEAGVPIQIISSANLDSAKDLERALALHSNNRRAGGAREFGALGEYDLARALVSKEEFRIVLQPQIDMKTGKMVGAEALARWNHPEFGSISPATFIPLAHRTGLDLLLFHAVEAKVAALLGELHRSKEAIPIAVNASAQTLCTAGLAQRLEQRLSEYGVPNSLLKIEMTEDEPVRDKLALSTALLEIRMRGFPIAIDDFGCGFSSIDLLTQMPFSELKIDGRFVRNMVTDAGCNAAVSAAIAMAKAMLLNIVAEGIESKKHMEALLEQGCRIGQGFALCLPLEVEDFVRSVTEGRSVSPLVH
ncbi:hypothetical protein A7J71_20605 [Achromobacter insolitus]|nr:hypothetical protein A7J71_20605 [Achromobacter insolitus]OCZ52940.1 hypothetical protein A7P22_16245 [Achromobacter insolitus]